MAVVEIANLNAVVKQHAVPLPVKAVCKQDVSLGSFRNNSECRTVNFFRRADSITEFQIDLIGVGLR
jgi:hypothetical protein